MIDLHIITVVTSHSPKVSAQAYIEKTKPASIWFYPKSVCIINYTLWANGPSVQLVGSFITPLKDLPTT